MNIITGLSVDTFVWLRAERYFNKQACAACMGQHYVSRVALYLSVTAHDTKAYKA